MNSHDESDELSRLRRENDLLRCQLASRTQYIREKVNRLLGVMGTAPLRHDELDDATLVELDPIGILADTFEQVLAHLHQTNAQLQLANEEILAIFETSSIGIMVLDGNLRIQSFNRTLGDYFFPDRDRGSIIGSSCRDLICQGNEPGEECLCRLVLEGSGTASARGIQYQGRYFDIVFRPFYDREGKLTKCLGFYHDITHLKQGEEALRRSEERYRDLFENANDLIQSVTPDGRFIYTNRAWRGTLGYSEAEVSSLNLFDIIDPACHEHCRDLFGHVMSGQSLGQVEVTFVAKGGRKIVVEGSANCNLENGLPIATRSIFRDVTARKHAEEALATEKERLAVTLRSIGDGVITTDTGGKVVLMNKIAEELTGFRQEEGIGRLLATVFRVYDPATGKERENLAEAVLRTGKALLHKGQTALLAKDRTRRIIAESGAPICNAGGSVIGTVLVFRDITEQEELKAHRQRAEKLDSLGILAGGIAHDFNNMLTGVFGNIAIAKMWAGSPERVAARLEEAEKAALRARDLTQQLLTFAKGGAPVRKTSSIAELLTDLSNFALRGSNVRCCLTIPDDLWPGNVDPGQISQVIHNLLINADQAMPDGGQILVEAENVVVGERDRLPIGAGKYIHISIADTGPGIPPHLLPMIFDPYFTTKEKGSGLGLATSYSIVSRHDGCITVESEEGKGATFHIYLPASAQKPAAPQAMGQPVAGTGKILVMDDEQTIRDVARELLETLGYRVTLAEHGEDAIAFYRAALESGEPFSAVIMDLTVPGAMGGKETIRHLLEIDPEVKALVSSGYSNDPVLANYRKFGFSGVVLKPYAVADLSATLKSVLTAG